MSPAARAALVALGLGACGGGESGTPHGSAHEGGMDSGGERPPRRDGSPTDAGLGASDVTIDPPPASADAGGESTPGPALTEEHCPTPARGHPAGQEVFVGGGGLDGRLGVSLDGETWADVTTASQGPSLPDHTRNMIRGVGYADGLFLAVGGFDNAYLSISCDGVNFRHDALGTNQVGPPPAEYSQFLEEVAGLGAAIVAVGGAGIRLTSTDLGLTWSQTGIHHDGHLRAVAAGNGLLVAVGHDFQGNGIAVTSSDGSSWTPVEASPGDLYHLAFGNGRFVAVGPNRCSSSTDGRTWSGCNAGSQFLDVRFVDGRFFALSDGAFVESSDGVTWTPSPVFLPLATVGGADRFVMVDIDTRGYSFDLASWTRVAQYGGLEHLTVGRVLFDPP